MTSRLSWGDLVAFSALFVLCACALISATKINSSEFLRLGFVALGYVVYSLQRRGATELPAKLDLVLHWFLLNFFTFQVGSFWGVANWVTVVFSFTANIFFISRIFSERHRCRRLILLLLFSGVLVIMCLWGAARFAQSYYHQTRAITHFSAGEFSAAGGHIVYLASVREGAFSEDLSIEKNLSVLLEMATERDYSAAAYVVLGDIARSRGLFALARMAYEKALDKAPDRSVILAKLGVVLFKQGFRFEALSLLDSSNNKKGDLGAYLGAMYAQMGDWDRATILLDMALQRSGEYGEWEEVFARRGVPVECVVADLITDALLPVLDVLSFYDVVRLLQAQGIKVLFPNMEIGSTGVETPIDLVATSGGGWSTSGELQLVGGVDVSNHGHGYNIAVIDPGNGAVEQRRIFNSWHSHEPSEEMAKFLNGLPEKKIIMATINGDGSKNIAKEIIGAWEGIGAVHLPNTGWSHAVIGIKGAGLLTAMEEAAHNAHVHVGALKGNIKAEWTNDRWRLHQALRDSAAVAPGKIAIFIGDTAPSAPIIVVRL
jgi:tetratricopeptide (TPR) repeat protein